MILNYPNLRMFLPVFIWANLILFGICGIFILLISGFSFETLIFLKSAKSWFVSLFLGVNSFMFAVSLIIFVIKGYGRRRIVIDPQTQMVTVTSFKAWFLHSNETTFKGNDAGIAIEMNRSTIFFMQGPFFGRASPTWILYFYANGSKFDVAEFMSKKAAISLGGKIASISGAYSKDLR